MELEFKKDFEQARSDWSEFWSGQRKHPMVYCIIPKPDEKIVERPAYLSGHDGNFTPVIDQILAWAASHLFLGSAIPYYYLEFGPDHFSSFLGCDLDFSQPGTSWATHWVQNWDDVEIHFQRDGIWWQRTLEFIRSLRARLDGKMLIAAPTLVSNIDALAALRGINDLMVDLHEEPEKIHRALKQLDRAYSEILNALALELDIEKFGSINRHGLYCRGRTTVPQCDSSCMISPEMFTEFALPHLKLEMAQLDAVEYHLDGPGAIKHLEALCAIEKLGLIQWVPGSGNENKDWSELYRQIDRLGKGHLAAVQSAEELRLHWGAYQSRMIHYHYIGPPQEGAGCLAEAQKLTK